MPIDHTPPWLAALPHLLIAAGALALLFGAGIPARLLEAWRARRAGQAAPPARPVGVGPSPPAPPPPEPPPPAQPPPAPPRQRPDDDLALAREALERFARLQERLAAAAARREEEPAPEARWSALVDRDAQEQATLQEQLERRAAEARLEQRSRALARGRGPAAPTEDPVGLAPVEPTAPASRPEEPDAPSATQPAARPAAASATVGPGAVAAQGVQAMREVEASGRALARALAALRSSRDEAAAGALQEVLARALDACAWLRLERAGGLDAAWAAALAPWAAPAAAAEDTLGNDAASAAAGGGDA